MAVPTVIDRFRSDETQVKVLHAVEWMREMPLCFQHASGLKRLLIGSVAEAVVRHAPCSVDIVRMPLAAADREALQARHAGRR
jgi:hypothetical protein